MNRSYRFLFLVSLALWSATASLPAFAQDMGSSSETGDMAMTDMRVQVIPRDSTTLASELGARINRLDLREGERFAKGEMLIGFDCSTQKAALDEAEAILHATEITVAANKRMVELRTVGKLEYQLSLAEQEKAKAKLAAAEAIVRKCEITAPFDGRIVEQKVHAEQFVQPGQALLDILDDSILEVEFVVPSSYIGRLPVGTAVGVLIEETGKTYPVRISRIGARIDPVSQTIKMTAAFDERDADLIVGMSGYLVFSSS